MYREANLVEDALAKYGLISMEGEGRIFYVCPI